MNSRVDRLLQLLRDEGIGGFALINIESSDTLNLRYLTGFCGSFGILILTPTEQIFLTDSRYLERARGEVEGFAVAELRGKWAERLSEQLGALGLRSLGVNSLAISLHEFNQLQEQAAGVELVPLEGPVEKLRLRKDEREISLIKSAAELTDRAFAHAQRIVEPGMSEREVAWELEKFMRENGSDGIAFPIIAAAGENSAFPHHLVSDYRLRQKDLLLLDMGARYEGYCADLTRVICVGEPSRRQLQVHGVVHRAQGAALEEIRAGMSGVEADRIARELIQEAQFGDSFGHGLGHGVGLAVHEGPRLSPLAGEDILEPGMVVTVEPGVYLGGEFGVRIEDLCVVRPEGLEVLTESPRELRSI